MERIGIDVHKRERQICILDPAAVFHPIDAGLKPLALRHQEP